jgi:hypothetical protein
MTAKLDAILIQLLPQVLADRELGNGRSFTRLHLRRLWALTCLYTGECIDEADFAARVYQQLPPQLVHARDGAARKTVSKLECGSVSDRARLRK